MPSFMLSFTVVVSATLLLLNGFIFVCLFYRIGFLKKWRWFIAAALVAISVLELYYMLSFRHEDGNILLLQLAAGLIGVTFLFFFFTLIYFILRIPIYALPFDASRREALKKIVDITILIAAFSTIFSGFINGFKKPIKRFFEVKIKGLSQPLSIAHITDVHIGKVLGVDFMSEVVKLTNELDADIVAITGDLVDLTPNMAREKLEPLRDLKSRYGVYFVLGNHEYFNGKIDSLIELLESFGINVLTNKSSNINGTINLCGINDVRGAKYKEYKPDINETLSKIDANLPTILLSHQPKIVNYFSGDEKIDLVISGHTHGGQIFPFGLFVLIDQPYLYGLNQHSETTQVFVSSGAGYWGPPLRILAPSEVVKLSLMPE